MYFLFVLLETHWRITQFKPKFFTLTTKPFKDIQSLTRITQVKKLKNKISFQSFCFILRITASFIAHYKSAC